MIYTNLAADGQTDSVGPSNSATRKVYDVKAVTVAAYGTWGSGTIVLQFRTPSLDTTWRNITGASWGADFTAIVDISKDWDVRLSLSGSTSPDLDVYVQIAETT